MSFNLDEFFGMNDDSNPLMMLIWILPIILFVFYGQRIQLMVSSNEIKKSIDKLEKFRNDTKKEFIDYLKKTLNPKIDPTKKLEDFFEYFTIMPVDLDPNGIIPKINHLIRSRDDFTRMHVKSLFRDISDFEITKVHNLLEIVTTLQMFHKATRHLYLTAKKQKNFPLILPLQMMIPFVMEEAEALKDAMTALKNGQPIGDGIGPMVVGGMMINREKQKVSFQTVLSKSEYEDRKLLLVKAEGPNATVGRLGEAIEKIFSTDRPDLIIMVDASLKLEGEDSASIAKGFGAAMGGIGTDRFQIEDVATKNSIPILAIVIKQSIHEALTIMTKEIADQASSVRLEIQEMIRDNTQPKQTVMIIGVGNTLGVSQ
ncbi:DUF1512 domain-containing protein [Candidatus Nitrosopelagicus sp.]|nr:DUF1512 domain-containing protein [Candidatus Nitrosopelagicus sp.]